MVKSGTSRIPVLLRVLHWNFSVKSGLPFSQKSSKDRDERKHDFHVIQYTLVVDRDPDRVHPFLFGAVYGPDNVHECQPFKIEWLGHDLEHNYSFEGLWIPPEGARGRPIVLGYHEPRWPGPKIGE